MRLADFFENFEVLAAAPGGVARLREAVLGLAVRGRLVAQDPADEPAAVLLERIAVERSRLVKEKKIKKSEPLPPISSDEMPFDLPVGWEWRRFHEIACIASNLVKPNDFLDLPHIAPDSIEKYTGVLLSYQTVFEDNLKSSKHKFNSGQILYSKIRPNLSKAIFVDFEGLCSADMYPIDALIYPKYLLKYILSSVFLGMAVKTDTRVAMPKINQAELNKIIVPIPPLSEQKRIVEAVDRLMEQLDRLEAQQTEQRDRLQILGTTATTQLTGAAETRDRVWPLVRDRFGTIYDTPENVEQLRQTILQLAVMGRLVPQDPNDEPASVLLERIRAEKARLIKEKKIKPSKPLPPISSDEMPFDLPNGWEWINFADVIIQITSGWSPQCEKRPREGNEWGVLKVSAVSWGVFKEHENKALPSNLKPRPEHEIQEGDFLMSRANTSELVGKSVIVQDEFRHLMMCDKILKIFLSRHVCKFFYNLCNNSTLARFHYSKEASGTSDSMRNISRSHIHSLALPLPPAAEQKRIVATVDRLMTHCDQLQTQLQTRSDRARALLDSAIHQLSQTA